MNQLGSTQVLFRMCVAIARKLAPSEQQWAYNMYCKEGQSETSFAVRAASQADHTVVPLLTKVEAHEADKEVGSQEALTERTVVICERVKLIVPVAFGTEQRLNSASL